MASHRPHRKSLAFGVSAPVLIAGATALVLVGIAGGIALDVMVHGTPERVVTARPAPRPAPRPPLPRPPVLRNLPEEVPATPSIFAPRPEPRPGPRQEPQPEAIRPPAAKAAPPLLAFAVPVDLPRARPVLAVVIDDLGLDRARALRAIGLPGPLTLSLMTYASDLPGLTRAARAAGHEVMAHVPMEPLDPKEHPGPRALTVAMSDAAIRETLAADLDGWQGYVGINNHMGSRFTRDRARMDVVMADLKARGLLWLDSKTTTESAGSAAALAAGVPAVERDVFLDNTQTAAAVRSELDHAVATAKARGSAVAIGHPHDVTLAALAEVLSTLEERGVSLAPISEVQRRRRRAD
jgi:polysaccharide deacetylase 2 family uncharacterized protein YibQ